MSVPETSSRLFDLIDRYDGVLLDAYGVLNDARGVLPGARELIARLHADDKPFAVVTNDASRSPITCANRFAGMGLDIPAARIVTSGSLLPRWLKDRGFANPRTRVMVLGTSDARAYVESAGATIAPLDDSAVIDVLAVCDDAGFDFLPGVEAALTAASRALDQSRPLALVLPNPDLIYPRGGGALGLTAGSIALVIETALSRRHKGAPRFVHLGKPERHLFDAAATLLGTRNLLMVGDQFETDIVGARGAGLDAALLVGVNGIAQRTRGIGEGATYLIDALV